MLFYTGQLSGKSSGDGLRTAILEAVAPYFVSDYHPAELFAIRALTRGIYH